MRALSSLPSSSSSRDDRAGLPLLLLSFLLTYVARWMSAPSCTTDCRRREGRGGEAVRRARCPPPDAAHALERCTVECTRTGAVACAYRRLFTYSKRAPAAREFEKTAAILDCQMCRRRTRAAQ